LSHAVPTYENAIPRHMRGQPIKMPYVTHLANL